MSERLELPKIDSLPQAVLFHREHPGEPHVVLQVPNADRTNAETYVLRMDRPSDVVWLRALPRGQAVIDMLSLAPHIVLYTKTGHVEELTDRNAPTVTQEVMELARSAAAGRRGGDDRNAALARRSRQHLPPPSPLRQYLGGARW